MAALYSNTLTCAFSELSSKLDELTENTSITISDPENVVIGDSDTNGTLGYIIKNYTGNFLLDFSTSNFSSITYAGTDNSFFTNCTKLSGMCALPTGITDARYTFDGCSNLVAVDTSTLSSVENAMGLFRGCTSLSKVDSSVFTKVTVARLMFKGCTSLVELNTSAFTNVVDASNMFADCTGFKSIDTSSFSKVSDANGMFSGCTELTSIETKYFTNVVDSSNMFSKCTSLTSIDTTSFSKVETAVSMFYNCIGLTSIDTTPFIKVTNANNMFENCFNVNFIDTFAFSNVMHADYMFSGCSGLVTISTNKFLNVISAKGMFSGCSKLAAINLSYFTIASTIDNMLYGCSSLSKIYLGGNIFSLDSEPKVNNNFLTQASSSAVVSVKEEVYGTWYSRLYTNYTLWGLTATLQPTMIIGMENYQTYDIDISGNAATATKADYATTVGTALTANQVSSDLTLIKGDSSYVYNGSKELTLTVGGDTKLSLTSSSDYSSASSSVDFDGLSSKSYTTYLPNQSLNTDSSPTFSSLSLNGSLSVNGSLIQNGTAYETHAEKVYTTNDLIITRDNAVGKLSDGEYTGIEALKYDGTNNGYLVFDNSGTAFVGDEGKLQPLATRSDTSSMTSGNIVVWDADNVKMTTSSSTVGSTSSPIYLKDGAITEVAHPTSGSWFQGVPYISSTGVIEVGKYIDFHATNDSSVDYDVRLTSTHESSTDGSGNLYIMANNVVATKFTGSLNGNAATSSYPLGFSNRDGSQGWGNQTGTYITDWEDNTGGSVAFRRDCPSSGQCSMIIDGKIYQNEGQYEVIDSNTIGSQSVNYASSAGSVSATASDGSTSTLVSGTMGSNDFFRVLVGGSNNSGYAEIATADDATEPIYVRQYSGTFSSLARTATLLDGSGNTSFPGTVSASSFSGNASSASHLLINGVTYDSNWYWNGQSGQPSWLWGSNDGQNMYVWNPSNFSVNYASTSETANKIRTSSPGSPADGDIWMV
jgi:hypothetical protein